MGLFDGLPVSPDKKFVRDNLSKIDENWATARFDSLPHVVQILTSKDREGDVHSLKEQIEVVEDIVNEVVHAYHGGFNKAIQNYSQILRLFSESSESISLLKVDLAEAKKCLGSRNKQLHQQWYRSVTLRHIIALLDQIESIAKVPGRIEKFLSEKQFYAAVQVCVQSSVMLEREGLQTVGALQDIRSELSKLRGVLFFKIFEELHLHLYNKGQYSLLTAIVDERDDELPTATAASFDMGNSHSFSRRTKLIKDEKLLAEGQRSDSVDGRTFASVDGESSVDFNEESVSERNSVSMRNGDVTPTNLCPPVPIWLASSTPDEFVEAIRKSSSPVHVKYLQTMVECLCMLGKVGAAGAVICQRLRSTIHEIITSKIKAHVNVIESFASGSISNRTASECHKFVNGQLNGFFSSTENPQNGFTNGGALLSVSPVSPLMTPSGKAQIAAKKLLDCVFDTIAKILDNHVVVGELLEAKSSQNVNIENSTALGPVAPITSDSEISQITGGFSIFFSLNILQSECQQLICEILRATPEAVATDSSVQSVRLPSKGPSKDKKGGTEDGLAFSFRFVDTTIPAQSQGTEIARQGWNRRIPTVSLDGYGSASVLPEQGIYLAASVYRPVLEFTDKVTSLLPTRYSTLGNDTLLTFTEKFLKDHFLPTMFVDYRKSVQQAISSPTAFRPRAHPSSIYSSSIEQGRPILQGLLAVDYLAKEVLGWANVIPKFTVDLVNYVQTFLERTYERCRTSYMEAVLEKQSYMLIGRHDIEKLLRLDPASSYLPTSRHLVDRTVSITDSNFVEMESELCDILLNLRPIKQENLIRDDNKLILLACLSDSLQYTAESMESLAQRCSGVKVDGKSLTSFANDYRRLASDCLKVLCMEMLLETIFNMQEMMNSDYMEAQTAEEPDDFIISLTALITRRDEEVSPFVDEKIRSYIFGGICAVAAHTSIMALADMKSINLFGVQQICRNCIALEQTLATIPSIDSESVQQKIDRVCSFYELLNMPYEALLAFITEHNTMFTPAEYSILLKVEVPGRDIPDDALHRLSEILPH